MQATNSPAAVTGIEQTANAEPLTALSVSVMLPKARGMLYLKRKVGPVIRSLIGIAILVILVIVIVALVH